MRLFTGLLAAQSFDSELMGDASLMQRPMERVAAPLTAMGARVATTSGRPPITVEGGDLTGVTWRTVLRARSGTVRPVKKSATGS